MQETGLVTANRENQTVFAFVQTFLAFTFATSMVCHFIKLKMNPDLNLRSISLRAHALNLHAWKKSSFTISILNKHLPSLPNFSVLLHGLQLAQIETEVDISKVDADDEPPMRKP